MSEKIIDLEQLRKSFGLEVTAEELLELIVEQHTMTTKEVMDMLAVSKQRIHGMKNQGLLRELKKGLYSKRKVELMRTEQIRQGRLKKFSEYELMPAYKEIEGSLLIDELRFGDCLKMVKVDSEYEKYDPTEHEYNVHLEEVLTAVVRAFKANTEVTMLDHKGFEYVADEEDLEEAKEKTKFVKTFSITDFLEMLQSVPSKILGMPKINRYSEIISELTALQEQNDTIQM